jgi:hypothetical protein
MSMQNSILLVHGDAEARLLVDAEAAVQAMFPDTPVALLSAWATRPDWLELAAPASLLDSGALPAQDLAALLQQPHRLIVFSLFPAIAVPALRHRDGGVFLAHHGVAATWSPETVAAVESECTQEPPLAAADAAAALEPVIERLQAQGSVVAVCTAFRRVREPLEFHRRGGPPTLRERIRQLNLEVARLSQRTGCFVLDLDRPLAQQGGGSLVADCFGGDGRAAEIALDEFGALLLDALPDGFTLTETS